MREYNFFWKDILVGNLFINEKGQYLFKVDITGKEKALSHGMFEHIFPKEQKTFGNVIPFFAERLRGMEDESNVKFFTDNFILQKINQD